MNFDAKCKAMAALFAPMDPYIDGRRPRRRHPRDSDFYTNDGNAHYTWRHHRVAAGTWVIQRTDSYTGGHRWHAHLERTS